MRSTEAHWRSSFQIPANYRLPAICMGGLWLGTCGLTDKHPPPATFVSSLSASLLHTPGASTWPHLAFQSTDWAGTAPPPSLWGGCLAEECCLSSLGWEKQPQHGDPCRQKAHLCCHFRPPRCCSSCPCDVKSHTGPSQFSGSTAVSSR